MPIYDQRQPAFTAHEDTAFGALASALTRSAASRPAPRPIPQTVAPQQRPAGSMDLGAALTQNPRANTGGVAEAGSFVNGYPSEAMLDRVRWIESKGDPNAVSTAGALGAYQIMPATAADPGFGVSPIDRAGILDPTDARGWARDYLGAMHRRYNNPGQALAAYNAGAGTVDRAIERGGATGYINYLPGETQRYVNAALTR